MLVNIVYFIWTLCNYEHKRITNNKRSKQMANRRHSGECIPPPRHGEIGTASLMDLKCVTYLHKTKVRAADSLEILRHPEALWSTGKTMISTIPEYVLYHFQHFINCCLVYNLLATAQISWKSAHNFSSYPADRQSGVKREAPKSGLGKHQRPHGVGHRNKG